MRRLKDGCMDLKIDRPFAIFVQEADDIPGVWVAHVVGHELDNVTQGHGPEDAVLMTYDLLRILTGMCTPEHREHDLSIETVIPESRFDDTGEVIHPELPAWECSRCHDRFAKTRVVEDR